jgi:hypothetical protein
MMSGATVSGVKRVREEEDVLEISAGDISGAAVGVNGGCGVPQESLVNLNHVTSAAGERVKASSMEEGVIGVPIVRYRSEKSVNGYSFDVIKSGLQKYIRRGMFNEAIYCAVECDLFKMGGHGGERLRTNFIHRLMVSFLEDVGTGCLEAWPAIDKACFGLLAEAKKDDKIRKSEVEERFVLRAVDLLVKVPKSRDASHWRAVVDLESDRSKLAASDPDFSDILAMYERVNSVPAGGLKEQLNRIAASLKERKPDAVYWAYHLHKFSEKNGVELFDVMNRCTNSERLKKYIELGRKWWNELHIKERFMCWMIPMLGILEGVAPVELPVESVFISSPYDVNRSGKKLLFHDWVLDCHTRVGRSSGHDRKGGLQFADIGAHVENESLNVNQTYKKFYRATKLFATPTTTNKAAPGSATASASAAIADSEVADAKQVAKKARKAGPVLSVGATERLPLEEMALECGLDWNPKSKGGERGEETGVAREEVEKESAAFEFIVRAQLVTSAHKQDTYFAKDRASGKIVVVKGPYLEEDRVKAAALISRLKAKNGIPAATAEVRYLIPDMFPDTPLGQRKSMDRSAAAAFLVSDSLIGVPVFRKMHSSVLWPLTEVVDWEKTNYVPYLPLLNRAQLLSYVRSLLFRFVVGANDLADRNFMVLDTTTVVSVDEDVIGKEVNIASGLRTKKCELLRKFLGDKAVFDEVGSKAWNLPLPFQNKLRVVQDHALVLKLFKV